MSSYEELVEKNKRELLNDEQKKAQFEERFEERLAARSNRNKEDERRPARIFS